MRVTECKLCALSFVLPAAVALYAGFTTWASVAILTGLFLSLSSLVTDHETIVRASALVPLIAGTVYWVPNDNPLRKALFIALFLYYGFLVLRLDDGDAQRIPDTGSAGPI